MLAAAAGLSGGHVWSARQHALAAPPAPPPPVAAMGGSVVSDKVIPVTVVAGGVELRLPRTQVGVANDVKRLERTKLASSRTFGNQNVFPSEPLGFAINDERLASFVRHLKAQVESAGVAAHVDPSHHAVLPATPTVSIDSESAYAALRAGLARGRATIKVPTGIRWVGEVFVPKGLSMQTILGRFETEFDRHGVFINRGRNVKRAARLLDGSVIPPGGEFSFNAVVGPRIPRRGFREAAVIVRGELTSGWGGGVCQAASTLHAAAFLAGLEIIQHTPHSRPASYIPMGFDATVVWPHIDLKFRNPYDFPLVIRSWTDDGHHHVEVLGSDAPRQVSVDREFVATRPYSTRSVRVPNLETGVEQVRQSGMLGYTLRRVRLIREGTEEPIEETVEETTVVYPPTDRIVHTGG